MSITQSATDALGHGHRQASGLLAAIAPSRLVRAFRDDLRRQREYQRLLQMPEYLLEDIGLTRADIVEASRRYIF